MQYTLYEQFEDACKTLCDEFRIPFKFLKILYRYETPRTGVDYRAEVQTNDVNIIFHVNTHTDHNDPTSGDIFASLSINDSEISKPHPIDENLGPAVILYGNLRHWIKSAVYRYNIKNHPVNLESLFRGIHIKIYGFPDYSEPANTEFEIFISGLTSLYKRKITAYRFRHMDDNNSFSYSYSIFVPDSLLVVFPKSGGGGGGGGQMDFEFFEEQLTKQRKYGFERKFMDVTYAELEKFLLEKELKFEHSVSKKTVEFPTVSREISSVCKELFEDGHYYEAIFQATIVLEKTLKEKSGVKDKIGVRLVEIVFDKNNPILELVSGSEKEHEDERDGFQFILKGVFLGIKNPGSHSLPKIDNVLVVSQYLSFIDLLLDKIKNARKIK